MKNELAIVAIVKNEALYIREWIAYYKAIYGCDLIIYDNDSVDNTYDLAIEASRNCRLDVLKWHVDDGVSPQMSAYNDAIKRYRDQYQFLAFFDADEFLLRTGPKELIKLLTEMPEDVGAVAVNQRVFGSSGLKVRDDRLVIERFVKASEPGYRENLWVKSIYRSSCVEEIKNCHSTPLISGHYVLPDGTRAFDGEVSGTSQKIELNMFQLNHYILKSEEEFLIKRMRGGGMGATEAARRSRYEDMSFFHGRDALISKCEDRRMSVVTSQVRTMMEDLFPPKESARSVA